MSDRKSTRSNGSGRHEASSGCTQLEQAASPTRTAADPFHRKVTDVVRRRDRKLKRNVNLTVFFLKNSPKTYLTQVSPAHFPPHHAHSSHRIQRNTTDSRKPQPPKLLPFLRRGFSVFLQPKTMTNRPTILPRFRRHRRLPTVFEVFVIAF